MEGGTISRSLKEMNEMNAKTLQMWCYVHVKLNFRKTWYSPKKFTEQAKMRKWLSAVGSKMLS